MCFSWDFGAIGFVFEYVPAFGALRSDGHNKFLKAAHD